MLKYLGFCLLVLTCCSTKKPSGQSEQGSQSPVEKSDLIGAWTADFQDSSGVVTGLAIVAEGYYSVTRYDLQNRRFIYTIGGSWDLDGDLWTETYEFNTADSTKVGSTEQYQFKLEGNNLIFTESGETWTKVDDGTPGALNGAWLITGRQRDGEISRRVPGARKTMKILSGTKFQWIAYHTGTGRFSGTGGGSYTTTDSVYTENIEFFSRDPERVGASLEFNYRLDSGEWHHRGLSSRGTPIYEIWTPRAMLEESE